MLFDPELVLRSTLGPPRAVTPRFAANVSMLFTELPFAERFDAATAAGFEGVEFHWPDEPVPPGFEVVLMNFDGGDIAAGERGYRQRPRALASARARGGRARAPLGCTRMNALVGLDDGRPRVASSSTGRRTRSRSPRAQPPRSPCSSRRSTRSTTVRTCCPTPPQAAAFVQAVGEPNVALQYDVFHMTRMGEDVEAALRSTSTSSPTSRSPTTPGAASRAAGRSTSRRCSRCSTSSATTGWVGAEYRPTGRTEESLGWLPTR